MDDEAARTIAVDAFMERVTGVEKRKMQGPTEAGRGEHRRIALTSGRPTAPVTTLRLLFVWLSIRLPEMPKCCADSGG